MEEVMRESNCACIKIKTLYDPRGICTRLMDLGKERDNKLTNLDLGKLSKLSQPPYFFPNT